MTDHSLTQGDAPVIGGNKVMMVDIKSGLPEILENHREKKPILENPSAQGHELKTFLPPNGFAASNDEASDRSVEFPGDPTGRDLGHEVSDDPFDDPPRIDDKRGLACPDKKRVRFVACGVGDHLELDGGLTLVMDLIAEGDEAGDRVKDATHAGGQGSIDSLFDHSLHHFPLGEVHPLDEFDFELLQIVSKGLKKVDHGDSPRFPDRSRPPCQRDLLQMAEARKVVEIDAQEFAPPDRSIRTEARAVQSDTDRVAFDAVFDHAAHDMGMVMLDADFSTILERKGVLGGEIVRMKIVDDRPGFDREEPLEMGDALLEGGQGLEIFEISDMVAHEGIALSGETEGIFQLGSTGQHALHREGELDRKRNIASRPSEERGPPFHHPGDRIVASDVNLAIVQKEVIRDLCEPDQSFFVLVSDRFVADVAARHHQSLERPLEQKMVKG